MTTPGRGRSTNASGWSAWRVVIAFGVVSLAVDVVADGARSIAGPLLGQLGANALTVGLVTGGSEALGFILRLISSPTGAAPIPVTPRECIAGRARLSAGGRVV